MYGGGTEERYTDNKLVLTNKYHVSPQIDCDIQAYLSQNYIYCLISVSILHFNSLYRHSEVNLHCDKHAYEARIETKGDADTTLLYVFDLYTICACPGECGPGGIPSPTDVENIVGGIGIGIILL